MTFADLFAHHWDKGTGRAAQKLPGQRAWNIKEFADCMSACGCGVSEDAVSNWLKGVNTPRRPQAMAILEVFFGTADEPPERATMHDAWLAQQRPGARRERAAPQAEPPPPNAAEWHRVRALPFGDTAALELHTPRPNNSGGHHLHGSLLLGEGEHAHPETKAPFLLSLNDAYITVEASDALTIEGSVIGKRETHDNLAELASGLRVIGPTDKAKNADGSDRAFLAGEVFGGSHIAVLEPSANGGDVEVTVSLSVPRRAVHVTPIDEHGALVKEPLASEAKSAVLDAIIFNAPGVPKDGRGYAVIQRAKLKRALKE